MTRPTMLAVATVTTAAAASLPALVGPYQLDLAARALALALLAAAVTLLTGQAGIPTLGPVAPYAAGAYTTANLVSLGLPALPSIIAGALAGGLCAAVLLPVVIRTRGIVSLMVSLAVAELTATTATAATPLTGGSNGLVIPAARPWWGLAPMATDQASYWLVVAVAAMVLSGTALALHGRAGLLLAGIRQDELRMRTSGHPIPGYLAVTYLAAGLLAGTGGALLVIGQTFISPGDVGFDAAALTLLAATIGGIHSIGGALAGAALVVATQSWLSSPWPGHGPLILGALFVAVVYLLPHGAAGLPAQLSTLTRRADRSSR